MNKVVLVPFPEDICLSLDAEAASYHCNNFINVTLCIGEKDVL
jgi:hypothetical protein